MRQLDEPDGALPSESKRWQPSDWASDPPSLFAAPDGSAVFLGYNNGSVFHQSWTMSVLDTKADWPADYAPAQIALNETYDFLLYFLLPSRLVATDSGLWLLDSNALRPLDVPSALQGKPLPAGVALDTPAIGIGSALDSVYVLETSTISGVATGSPAKMLRVAADGTASAAALLPGYSSLESPNFVLSRSGRRIYSLRGSGSERRLVTAVFDPETGDTHEELAPIPMPAGATALVPFANGEKMLVVDSDNDRLLLVE